MRTRLFPFLGVTFLTLLLPFAGSSQPLPCPPTATVDGPTVLVRDINAILTAHGVSTTVNRACAGRSVRARLVLLPDDSGHTLTTVDDAGRTSVRIVGNAAAAASLIESWAIDEDASLLTTLPLTTAHDVTTAQGAPESPTAASIFGGPEVAVGWDHSLWLGFSVGACGRLGPICLGGRLRTTRDLDVFGPTRTDLVLRTNLDLMLTSAWMFRYRGLWLAPMMGLGPGFMRTTTEGGLRQDAVVTDDNGLSADLSLLAGWPLSARAALSGELGLSWSPLAHTADRRVSSALIYGQPGGHVRAGLSFRVTL